MRKLCIVLSLLAVMSILYGQFVYAGSGTGTLSGHSFMDDNGNFKWDDNGTDSNGHEDEVETALTGLVIYILDSNGLHTTGTNLSGDWSYTVSTASDVAVWFSPVDLVIPIRFKPTTNVYHLISPVEDEDLVVPDFGVGPQEE